MSDPRRIEQELQELNARFRDYKRQTTQMRRRYEESLREYQGEVDGKILDLRLHEDEEYRKLTDALQAAEREWAEKNDELERLIADLRKGRLEKDRMDEAEALRSVEVALRACERVGETPHELFFPKRLDLFGNAIKDAESLQKMGMNEAAAAISISTRFGVERLGYDVNDLRDEWEHRFLTFQEKIGTLLNALEKELSAWAREREGKDAASNDLGGLGGLSKMDEISNMGKMEKRMRSIEVDYWSKGEFLEIKRRAEKYGQWIDGVKTMGIDKYLKTEGALGLDALNADILKAGELSLALTKLSGLYKARYRASCQREDWGTALIDFMTGEIDLTLIEGESGYRRASEEVLQSSCFRDYVRQTYGEDVTEDTREWLELTFENAMNTRIFVYIVPTEKNGEVKNDVMLYTDHNGSRDGTFDLEIYHHVLEALSFSED
ncbi:MAG: hypothetical protein LBO68_01040, partial [Synergistaceae bacterium]|nr:hypothetical protein [Synergistaceae bacterium]